MNKKLTLITGIVITTITVAILLTVSRLQKVTPIAPTAPESNPEAYGGVPGQLCTAEFDVNQLPAVPTPVCGNSQKELNEQCDDGNTTSGDGCSNVCLDETGSCIPYKKQVSIPITGSAAGSCDWSRGMRDGYAYGVHIVPTNYTPTDKICAIEAFDFSTGASTFRYDDTFIFTLHDAILAAGSMYHYDRYPNNGTLKIFNGFNTIFDQPNYGQNVPAKCIGNYISPSYYCLIPRSQNIGIFSFNIPESTKAELAAYLAGPTTLDFEIIAIGDNDPAIDCQVSSFTLKITTDVVPPGCSCNPEPSPSVSPSPTPLTQLATPTPTPTPTIEPTITPNPVAQCSAIKAYQVNGDINSAANWQLLSAAQLAALQPGAQIYFTTLGSAQLGATITRGRIQVMTNNSPLAPWNQALHETLSIKPKVNITDPDEYYKVYTIPNTGVTTFSVGSEVYSPQFDNNTNPWDDGKGWR